MAKKKVAMLPPKKRGKGPPHSHMMGGSAERDMPSGLLAGRPRTPKKK